MDIKTHLDNTLRVLKDVGWEKGDFTVWKFEGDEHMVKGYCLAGAVGAAYEYAAFGYVVEVSEEVLEPYEDLLKALAQTCKQLFPGRVSPQFADDINDSIQTIAHFNDHEDTTLDDITTVLMAAQEVV